MIFGIIYGIFIAGAAGQGGGGVLQTLYNTTLTEDQLRDRIPEPTVTLLKPRGFTVSIPGFLKSRLVGVELTGGINLYPPEIAKVHNVSFPIVEDCSKTSVENDTIWLCEINNVEFKPGDKLECVLRVMYNKGPIFRAAMRYLSYTVTEEELKKLNATQ